MGLNILLWLGGVALIAAGAFQVRAGDRTVTADNIVHFQRTPNPAPPAAGGDVFPMPINLTINGAQSTPSWITGPTP